MITYIVKESKKKAPVKTDAFISDLTWKGLLPVLPLPEIQLQELLSHET